MAKLKCYCGRVFATIGGRTEQPFAYAVATSWEKAWKMLGTAGFRFSRSGLMGWFSCVAKPPPRFAEKCPEAFTEPGIWMETSVNEPNPDYRRLVDAAGEKIAEKN